MPETLLSKDLDRLATGPLPLNSRVPAPLPGERCHRCHQRAPNLNGCALCYPAGICHFSGETVARENIAICPGCGKRWVLNPVREMNRFRIAPHFTENADADNR